MHHSKWKVWYRSFSMKKDFLLELKKRLTKAIETGNDNVIEEIADFFRLPNKETFPYLAI